MLDVATLDTDVLPNHAKARGLQLVLARRENANASQRRTVMSWWPAWGRARSGNFICGSRFPGYAFCSGPLSDVFSMSCRPLATFPITHSNRSCCMRLGQVGDLCLGDGAIRPLGYQETLGAKLCLGEDGLVGKWVLELHFASIGVPPIRKISLLRSFFWNSFLGGCNVDDRDSSRRAV